MSATRRLVAAGSAALACSCATQPAPVPPPPSLVGIWRMIETQPDARPCPGGTVVRYGADGKFVVQNGAQKLFGAYVTRRIAEGTYLVSTRDESHNGAANCRGLSAEYVLIHSPSQARVRIDGNRLEACLPPGFGECYLLERSSEQRQ